ncbi:MAG: ribokinase [Anaerolineae bacterium]
MAKIVVVGSLNMDLVVRTARLPAPGETVLGRSLTMAPGGKGANQAVAAARLGAQVALIGRIGKDDFGRALRDNLNAAGVDTTGLVEDADAPSGIALIQVDDSGQNTIVVAPGANAHLARADMDRAREAMAGARALIAQLEVPLDTVGYALELARQAGLLTVLNPSPARPLPREIFAMADLIAPNEVEAQALTGIAVDGWVSAEKAARGLLEQGARDVVITLGERGALAMLNGAVRRVLPFAVKAVDATAAGDAFVAALTTARAAGLSYDVALREAGAAGALTTTRVGAQPALPTRAELEEFMEVRGI